MNRLLGFGAVCGAALAATLIASLLHTVPAHAADKVEFAHVQQQCLQAGEIRFGLQRRWSNCKLTHSGFIGTIGLQDFFYAQYCLFNSLKRCDKQALVVFRNRAYQPDAFVEMTRIDPTGTRYEIPLLIGTDRDSVLTTAVRHPVSYTHLTLPTIYSV